MRHVFMLLALVIAFQTQDALAIPPGQCFQAVTLNHSQNHSHPVKHGFILMGQDLVFASHIVAEAPHNFQVLMQIEFLGEAKLIYQKSRLENPDNLILFVLDPIDLKSLPQNGIVKGALSLDLGNGEKRILASSVEANFKLIYFNELIGGGP